MDQLFGRLHSINAALLNHVPSYRLQSNVLVRTGPILSHLRDWGPHHFLTI
jgi:hypothetical protein